MDYSEDELKGLPERQQKLLKSKYISNTFGLKHPSFEDLADIDERLKDLESHVFRTARKETTKRGIQMLLMKELGFLDLLNEMNISGNKKAYLLSILLNASADNIKEDLSNIHRPDYKQNSIENYEFLLNTYKNAGLKVLAENADNKLDKLKSKK